MLPKNFMQIATVVAIFVGVVLLLGNMGVIPNKVMAFWPVILIIGGLAGLTNFDVGRVSKKSSKAKKKK